LNNIIIIYNVGIADHMRIKLNRTAFIFNLFIKT